ncbi:MAG TPA: Fic family protein [Thermoanaerobaculia bacterium]|nr:Fic family protein [Thermoanaerobaculia bacterium]
MPTEVPALESADSLYRGFPDFASWEGLPPEDVDLWSRFAASLERQREEARPEALKASVGVALRAAALDTGAIEGLYTVDRGFTMTVAVQGLAWEQMIEERGAGVRELFEAQLSGYELVLDAVTRKLPVTEAWIRALHETLCAPQRSYRVLTASGWQEHELPKGQYKTQPNHVRLADGSVHAYAPVDQVSAEMHRLVEQLRSPGFEEAHPVLQAAWVHYAFVAIHPFADGNGRVARALASVYFYRCCSIPLVIFANQRLAYFDALHAADLGEIRPLLGFFRDRGIDTMQMAAESLRTADSSSLTEVAERLRSRAPRRATLAEEDLFNLQERLLREALALVQAKLEQLDLASGVSLDVSPSGRGGAVLTLRHRAIPYLSDEAQILVVLETNAPAPFAFHLETPYDSLDIRLEDVDPEISEALKLRLDGWAQRLLLGSLRQLEERSRG